MKLREQVVTLFATAVLHHLGYARCAAQSVIEVVTCEELKQAVQLTADSGDHHVALAAGGVSCDEWTTFTIEHNKFHLVAEEGGSLPKRHVYALENVRFLVLSGVFQSDVALSFTTGVGNMIQEVNGGLLNVAPGAHAHFESAVLMQGVTIEGVHRGGFDETSGKGFGGCIYNQGSIRFEGYLLAKGCAIVGGQEGIAGNGGGIFNGKTGDIVFKGRANISDCRTTAPAVVDDTDLDDASSLYKAPVNDMSRGGGIYNEGKMWMFKTANFLDNASGAGGAIFNHGEMDFVQKKALFIRNRSHGYGDCYSGNDGRYFSGGQVLNTGSITFDGGVVFEDGRTGGFGGAIGNYGSVIINTYALFKRNYAGCMGGAISSPPNATFELLKDARFQANTVAYDEAMCNNWVEGDSMSFRCLREVFG